jgi:catechol 2,3-dioxygenase-like lactoylglutathione lyase family enzyme
MEQAVEALVQRYETGQVTRRQLIERLTLLAAGAVAGQPSTASVEAQSPAMPPSKLQPVSLHHVQIDVGDMKRSAEWYRTLFNLKPLAGTDPKNTDVNQVVVLEFGTSQLVLRPATGAAKPGSINHFAFGFDSYRPDAVEAEFKRLGVKARRDLVGSSNSFFVNDPDGLMVQISDRNFRL